MASVLPIDELNQLQISIESVMEDGGLSQEQKKKLIRDDIEEYYIMCYLMGVEQTENNFKREYKPNEDKMFSAVYKKYEYPEEEKKEQDFVDRISKYVEEENVGGLKNLADTGMTRLFSTGAWDAAESFGGGRKRWRTMEDDRVRPTHEALDGVRVPREDRFYTIDGDSARFPGDFADANNNCNCRCWIDILPE
jgi:hypothetical protein